MISARMRRQVINEVVDMTHVEAGDYFIKIIDNSSITHIVVEEVLSELRFIVRIIDNWGELTGNSFPMSAFELSKLHPNVPANQNVGSPRAVNG